MVQTSKRPAILSISQQDLNWRQQRNPKQKSKKDSTKERNKRRWEKVCLVIYFPGTAHSKSPLQRPLKMFLLKLTPKNGKKTKKRQTKETSLQDDDAGPGLLSPRN